MILNRSVLGTKKIQWTHQDHQDHVSVQALENRSTEAPQ